MNQVSSTLLFSSFAAPIKVQSLGIFLFICTSPPITLYFLDQFFFFCAFSVMFCNIFSSFSPLMANQL